jgi:hypothetical protein
LLWMSLAQVGCDRPRETRSTPETWCLSRLAILHVEFTTNRTWR